MIKNYFIIAWRNLLKNKGFTFINLTGLSIGIAACILIAIYILHETSYDNFVPKSENIFRLVESYTEDDLSERGIHFSANTASTMDNDFDEIIKAGRLLDNNLFYGAGENDIRIDGENTLHHEAGFSYADQSMIDIMGIKMVYGDAATALAEPKTIVLSKSKAEKYFQDENPVGRIIFLNGNDEDPFRIGGVMQDFPSNSHLDYNFLITLTGVEFGQGEQTRWLQNNYYTYILLKPGVDVADFGKKLSNRLVLKYLKPALKTGGFAGWETVQDRLHLSLQPLTAINLYSADINHETGFRNDIKIIWIFGIVALFILIIASINFINLSTAKSANRAKEVGLRKVVGSTKSNLIRQFLTESVLITIFAFCLGILLSVALLPFFRIMSGIPELNIPWSTPYFLPSLFLTALLVGLMAGLYPSFYLSRFHPINVLKGKLSMGSKSSGLRSSLVVFQFAISILLIIGTLIINGQLNYILNAKFGFDKDQVIQLYGTNMLGDKVQTFKEEVQSIPGVKNTSISDYLPIEGTKRNGNSFVNEGRENIDETVGGQAWVVDEDYIETLGMTLVQGRNFSRERSTDELATIINQEMAERLALTDPIGKKISRFGTLYEIIGVVENFNYNTMKEKVQPLCMFLGNSPSIISVKLGSVDLASTLEAIKIKWETFAPNLAFRYEFMDSSFERMYESVDRVRSIFTSFAVLAILVACLGLFALSAYMVEQRTKEIGVRKVLGASTAGLFKLLSFDFLKLVAIALLVACPVAYYFLDKWLQDFAYRITIHWTVFALAGSVALTVAILTVSFQSIKAARANPVKSLRSE